LPLFCCACLLLAGRLGGQAQTLTNLGQVRAVRLEDADQRIPVRVQCTVTFLDPEWRMCFVQDEAGSAFVTRDAPADDPSWKLSAGALVEIEGVISRGVVQCNITEQTLRVLGPGKPLKPAAIQDPRLARDAQWIKISGYLGAFKQRLGNKSELSFWTGSNVSPRVLLLDSPPGVAEAMPGAVVEILGTLGLDLDSHLQPTGRYILWVQKDSQIQILKKLPAVPIAKLIPLEGSRFPSDLVRVEGSVAGQRPGGYILVQDATGVLRVKDTGNGVWNTGALVEAVGSLSSAEAGPAMSAAWVHALASSGQGEGRAAGAKEAAEGANTNLTELTQAILVRSLSVAEAARHHPVRLTGVVTYSDSASGMRFIQDESAGIFVDLRGSQVKSFPPSGQGVELLGYSHPGDFAPVVRAESFRVLGERPLPLRKAVSMEALATGNEDSQWVSVTGVVRNQWVEENDVILQLGGGDTVVRVAVADVGQAASRPGLVDCSVAVQGVCATLFDDLRRLRGVVLYVPAWEQVVVKESPPQDVFAAPVRPAAELLKFQPRSGGRHREHLRGVVAGVLNDGSFYLQDESGGVLVQPGRAAEGGKLHEAVEVVGFPSTLNRLPVVQEALLKHGGAGVLPAPRQLSPESVLHEAWHGTEVRLQARVLNHAAAAAEESLVLQFGPWIVDALLEREGAQDQLAAVPPGSVVELTGVYIIREDSSGRPQSFQLLLRRPADVALISRPPWWTAQRMLWALGALGGVLLLVLVWVRMLRLQVRRQTRELVHEIEERKRMEAQVAKTHQELLVASRQAGMAEIATNVLHNVGNVLNSVNVSAGVIAERLRQSSVHYVGRAARLLAEHKEDLPRFLTQDEKGARIPPYLAQLGDRLENEQKVLIAEIAELAGNVQHINEIVAMQQNYAGRAGVMETISLPELVEDALRVAQGGFERHRIRLEREFESGLPKASVDKHKVLQILVNLLQNAIKACKNANADPKVVTVRLSRDRSRERFVLVVKDNGVGIAGENLTRIFGHGFTTWEGGHGFGLHSCSLAATELGGTLLAASEGSGLGATFTLELPSPHGEVVRENSIPSRETKV
jgi:signal transduction histidine kinase